jgi:hypothetical protein
MYALSLHATFRLASDISIPMDAPISTAASSAPCMPGGMARFSAPSPVFAATAMASALSRAALPSSSTRFSIAVYCACALARAARATWSVGGVVISFPGG